MKSRMLEHLRRCNSSLKVRSFATYRTFLEILLRSIEHPVAQSMLSLLKEKAYTDLVVLADSVSSTEYRTAAEHRLLNQLSAVVRKYPWPVGSVNFDPRAAATDTFYKSERRCARSNRRFALFDSLRAPYNYDLSLSRNWIQYVLGDLKLSDVWSHCDFGPGASIGIHGGVTNSARKILSPSWTVSPSAFDYARSAVMQDKLIWEALLERPGSPHYSLDPDDFSRSFRERSSLIDYNKIAFVPKTAKTERTIAVEPLLNGYVQKGIDVVMRKKLKRVGIDLQDQTRNQRLAREGSLKSDDPYVTIDLSSASDSISIGLCKHILPPDWFDFLDSVRSKHYLIDNRLTRYNKFVSMGNGFCFPLETLIFASLCEAAYQKAGTVPDYSVYGDDIIVRQSVASHVLALLRVCGFTANRDKTFLRGPFRESCGADWFEGEDVRPITLDYAFDSIQNIFKFCNLLELKGAWRCIFYEAREFLVSLIPKELFFCRPCKGNVDTALEVPLDVFLTSKFASWNRETFSWRWVEIRNSAYPDTRVKRFAGYSIALMRGALTGSTSPVPFAERRKTRTKIARISYSSDSVFLPLAA